MSCRNSQIHVPLQAVPFFPDGADSTENNVRRLRGSIPLPLPYHRIVPCQSLPRETRPDTSAESGRSDAAVLLHGADTLRPGKYSDCNKKP